MFAHQLRPGAQDEIYRGLHGRQVEIEISGRFPAVPALRTAGWLGIDLTQLAKTVCGLAGPRKRPWTPNILMFALGPKKSRAVRAEEPFISGAHQKVGAKVADIHRHRPARLAHIKHKQRTLGMAG